MARRAGSADLPLHGGRVPPWLAERMTRLGAVIGAGHRPSLRPRRAAAPARPSVLVPVLRRRHGHGLAFLRHHHQRHRRAQARADAASPRARHPRLRRTRPAFAANAARAGRDRRARRHRRRGAGHDQPAGRQGRQRRGAGRLRPLSARLHRHRRRPMDRRAAGHERRAPAGAALSLAVGGADELRRRSARRDRGRRQGEIVNLADRRAEPSRQAQLDLLAELGPDRIARESARSKPAVAGCRRPAAAAAASGHAGPSRCPRRET